MNIRTVHHDLSKLISEGFGGDSESGEERTTFLAECISILRLVNLNNGIIGPDLILGQNVYCNVLCVAGLLNRQPKGKSIIPLYYQLTEKGRQFYSEHFS